MYTDAESIIQFIYCEITDCLFLKTKQNKKKHHASFSDILLLQCDDSLLVLVLEMTAEDILDISKKSK